MSTEILRLDHPFPIAGFQTNLPFFLLWALPLAAWWNWRGRFALAITNGVIFLAFLALVSPAVFSKHLTHAEAGAPRLRVATANVFIDNRRLGDIVGAFRSIDADVLGITEFSDDLAAAMTTAGLDGVYRYHVSTPTPPGEELAIYSRFPIVGERVDTMAGRPAIDVEIEVDGTRVHTVLIHTLPPIDWQSTRVWRDELAAIGAAVKESTGPTIVFGDFNAGRWHPGFRRLLGTGDLDDAQELAGKGLSVSWPVDWPGVPPFARLDHVLVKGGMGVSAGSTRGLPGSDHQAVVADLVLIRSN